MYQTIAGPRVKIKTLRDEILIDDVVYPSGRTVECDEDIAVYLVSEGVATLSPGASLSGDAKARLAMIERATTRRARRREDVPMVRARCIGKDQIVSTDPWGGTRVIGFTMQVDGRCMSPGEEAIVREDGFVVALAANPGDVELVEGERLSPRALKYLERQETGDYRPY